LKSFLGLFQGLASAMFIIFILVAIGIYRGWCRLHHGAVARTSLRCLQIIDQFTKAKVDSQTSVGERSLQSCSVHSTSSPAVEAISELSESSLTQRHLTAWTSDQSEINEMQIKRSAALAAPDKAPPWHASGSSTTDSALVTLNRIRAIKALRSSLTDPFPSVASGSSTETDKHKAAGKAVSEAEFSRYKCCSECAVFKTDTALSVNTELSPSTVAVQAATAPAALRLPLSIHDTQWYV